MSKKQIVRKNEREKQQKAQRAHRKVEKAASAALRNNGVSRDEDKQIELNGETK
jgi:hypothetical protein